MRLTDDALAAAVARGDEQVFDDVVRRYTQPLYAFIRRYCGAAADDADAQDIVQEAFVKAYLNRRRYDPQQRLSTWLYAIARNSAIDWLRKRRPLAFSRLVPDADDSPAEAIADSAPLPDELFARASLDKDIAAALEYLAADDRAILVLHYTDGLTFDRIATILDIPMNTVKSRHRRSLAKLRTVLVHQNPHR